MTETGLWAVQLSLRLDVLARLVFVRKLFSDLNLNGSTPARVQPMIGEWGPQRVPSTSAKKRARIWVTLAVITLTVVVFVIGNYFFRALMGC